MTTRAQRKPGGAINEGEIGEFFKVRQRAPLKSFVIQIKARELHLEVNL